LHAEDVYRESVIVAPAMLRSSAVEEKLAAFAEAGIRVIRYGTSAFISAKNKIMQYAEIETGTDALFLAASRLGYNFSYQAADEKKKPAVAVHRHDNAFYFSVYNRDTTSESRFSFPLGAPILNGCDALIENDSASYCFPRGAHHECRAFVKQKSGTVRAREMAPVSAKYRRKLLISGLEDAVISLFPSSDCLDTAAVGSMRGDSAVELLQGFSTVSDENGTYLSKEHVSGSVCLLFPY